MKIEPPSGFVVRPPQLSEEKAVLELVNHCDREVLQTDAHRDCEFRIRWSLPYVELSNDVILVETREGELVGYGDVLQAPPFVQAHAFARVHPEQRGRGLGTFLLHWAEERARERIDKAPLDAQVILHVYTYQDYTPALQLFTDQGLTRIRHFSKMARSMEAPPEEPRWPEEIEVRPFVESEEQHRAVFGAQREAFHDHWGHIVLPFEEEYSRWRHWIDKDEELDVSLWFVAWDGEEIAGVALNWPKADDDPEMGWVGVLGVRRPWRRRGLGLALLLHSFGAFWERRLRKVGLMVDADSLTGATRLYERAGMEPDWIWESYEKVLRPGKDLRRQSL